MSRVLHKETGGGLKIFHNLPSPELFLRFRFFVRNGWLRSPSESEPTFFESSPLFAQRKSPYESAFFTATVKVLLALPFSVWSGPLRPASLLGSKLHVGHVGMIATCATLLAKKSCTCRKVSFPGALLVHLIPRWGGGVNILAIISACPLFGYFGSCCGLAVSGRHLDATCGVGGHQRVGRGS